MDKKIALVTGGGMGLGAAIATRLAQDGFIVVAADIDGGAAEQTAAALRTSCPEAASLCMDVSNAESVAQAFKTIQQRYGRCDVLVNNAGVAKLLPFLEMPLDDWNRIMAVNVTGSMLCAQHAARLMVQRQWGRIINLASSSALKTSPNRTAYGASKAAVIGLTRQIAVEMAQFGVTVNAIAPGPTPSPMTEKAYTDEVRRRLCAATPSGRFSTPQEIAASASFLASDGAAHVNGQTLSVDGGFAIAFL